jgi:hypothetical protein
MGTDRALKPDVAIPPGQGWVKIIISALFVDFFERTNKYATVS